MSQHSLLDKCSLVNKLVSKRTVDIYIYIYI